MGNFNSHTDGREDRLEEGEVLPRYASPDEIKEAASIAIPILKETLEYLRDR